MSYFILLIFWDLFQTMECLVDFIHYLECLECLISRWFPFPNWIQDVWFTSKNWRSLENSFDPIPVLYSHLFPHMFKLQWVRLRTSIPSTNPLPNPIVNAICGYHAGEPDYSVNGTLHSFVFPDLLTSSQGLFPKWIHGEKLLSKERRSFRSMLIPSQCLTS